MLGSKHTRWPTVPMWLAILTITLVSGNGAESKLLKFSTLVDDTNAKHSLLDELTEEKLSLNNEPVRKARSVLDIPVISGDNSDPFESAKDFYFYNSVNKDSGATEQIWISDILPVPTRIPTRRNEVFLDIDVIEKDGHKYLWLVSELSVMMIKHSITGNKTVNGPYITDITGAIASEPVVLLDSVTHAHHMFVFILKSLAVGKHLSWYLWDPEMERLVYKGSLEMNAMTTDIKLILVPVTNSYMLAALEHNTVAVYMFNVHNGLLSLILCHHIEAYGAKDLVSFSVNGQLYVAVANSYSAVSLIWRYRIHHKDFVLHQSLDMVNVTDLEYFWRGYEHYLAIVSHSRADIYQWKGAQFLHFQKMTLDHGGWPIAWHGIHHHDSYPDDVILFLVTSSRVVQFVWNKYQHQFTQMDGTDCVQWKKQEKLIGNFMPAQHSTNSEEIKDLCIKLRSDCIGTTMKDADWIMVKNSTSANVISGYSYYKFLHPAMNCWPSNWAFPLKMVSFATNEMYKDLVLISGQTFLHYSLYVEIRSISVSPTEDVPQFQYLIENLERQEKFLERTSELLDTIMAVEEPPHQLKSEDYPIKEVCPRLEERISFLHDRMNRINEHLKKSTSERTVHLRGLTTLKSLMVTGETEIGGDARVRLVNGLDMPHLFQDSVLKHVPSRIRGTKIFLGKATIEGPLRVQQKLNGQRISQDLILLNRPRHVDGTLKFLAPVTVQKDVDVKYRVNGVHLASEVVMLYGSKPQHLSGLKTFTSDVTVENEFVPYGNVNRVNIHRMAADTWTSSGKQKITGRKVFTRVSILGKLEAKLVNGVNLTYLDITTVRTNRPAMISAPKTFTETVEVGPSGKLVVDTINGLHIPEDLVPHSDANVVVEGHKEFLGKMTIAGNLRVHGRLAGVDLQDTVRTKGDQNLCGVKKFVGPTTFDHLEYTPNNVGAPTVVVHGNLKVENSLNGLVLQELYKDVIFKNESEVTFTAPITFTRPQVMHGSVKFAGLINGWNLTKDFVHRSHFKNVITGHKTFKGPVIFEQNVHLNSTLDGVDLNKFASEVVRVHGPPQIIHGRKTIMGNLTVNTLIDESKTLEPKISMDGWTTAWQMNVKGNVRVGGTVNGHILRSIANKRITLSTDQEITGSLLMQSNSEVEDLNVFGKINGVNISALSKDIFWKNSDQKQLVTGRKQLTGSVTIPHLQTSQGVNGFWLPDIKKRTVPVKNGTLNVGSYTFEKGITVNGPIWVHGTINGVNFSSIVKDSVSKSRPQLVSGLKVIDELHVKGNVWIKGHINDFKLEDVLTTTTPQNITGQYVFRTAKFNGANVTQPWSSKLVSYGSTNVHFYGDVTAEELWTGGDLNGVDFYQLWRNSIRKQHSGPCRIAGPKRIAGNVTFAGNLNVQDGINGYDYSKLLGKIVTVKGDKQIITALKEFSKDVEVTSSVLWSGTVKVKGLFNEVNISRLMTTNMSRLANSTEHAVISGDITIPSLVIYGNVFTSGTINNVNTSDILTNTDDAVFGTKIITDLDVKGNIASGMVNGWNLTALEMDTLKVNETQHVLGKKVVEGNITVVKPVEETSKDFGSGNLPLQYPLGKEPSSRLVTTEYRRPMHFHGNVDFHKGLTINTSDARNLSVEYSSDCVLSECRLLDALQDNLRRKAEVLDYFEPVQTESGHFLNAKMEILRNSAHLAMGFADCQRPLRIYSWNSQQESYLLNRTVGLYSVYKMVALKCQGGDCLLIDHYDCNKGVNVVTLIMVPWDLKNIIVLYKTVDIVFDLDAVETEDGVLLGLLKLSGKLQVLKLWLHNGRGIVVSSKEIALPQDASFCSVVSITVAGIRSYSVLVGFRHGQSRIYAFMENNLIGGADLRLVQIMSTPGASFFSRLPYHRELVVAINVARKASSGLKMYSVMPNSKGGIFLKEVDILVNMHGYETVSLDQLEMNGKSYLAFSTTDAIEVHVREGLPISPINVKCISPHL